MVSLNVDNFGSVFFGAVNSPNQSCSNTRYHSSGFDVAVGHGDAASSGRSMKQAM